MKSIISATSPGAVPADSGVRRDIDHDYGRRIEPDSTWTIYHVFTGVPAEIGKRAMVGMTENNATAAMIWLNAYNAQRRKALCFQ